MSGTKNKTGNKKRTTARTPDGRRINKKLRAFRGILKVQVRQFGNKAPRSAGAPREAGGGGGESSPAASVILLSRGANSRPSDLYSADSKNKAIITNREQRCPWLI